MYENLLHFFSQSKVLDHHYQITQMRHVEKTQSAYSRIYDDHTL